MKTITEKAVAALPTPKAGNKVTFFSGAALQGKRAPSGFGVRVTANGARSFVWFHRADGHKFLETIGSWRGNPSGGDMAVLDAIEACIARARAVAKGTAADVRPERTRRLEEVAKPAGLLIGGAYGDGEGEQKEKGLLDIFVERYCRGEAKLRTADQIEANFARLVYPEIGKISIYDIRRSHIVAMMDGIADESGPSMADKILAHVRKAFNWHATRDDAFSVPVVPGMARTKTKQRARKRVLDDQEIRDLWAGLAAVEDVPACYPAFIKVLFLTATRRTETAMMATNELDGDVWTIPGSRYKTKLDHVVPLTAAVRELIGKVPAAKQFIFSSTEGKQAFSGFSKAKVQLDAAIAAIREKEGREPMAPWVLHDLRRTARSLMSRAKIDPDHAERAVGHVIGGVRETYDRYEFASEKRAAFEALGALVNTILNPPKGNVTKLRA